MGHKGGGRRGFSGGRRVVSKEANDLLHGGHNGRKICLIGGERGTCLYLQQAYNRTLDKSSASSSRCRVFLTLVVAIDLNSVKKSTPYQHNSNPG